MLPFLDAEQKEMISKNHSVIRDLTNEISGARSKLKVVDEELDAYKVCRKRTPHEFGNFSVSNVSFYCQLAFI